MPNQLDFTSTTTTTTVEEAALELLPDSAFDRALDEAGWQALLIRIDQEEDGP